MRKLDHTMLRLCWLQIFVVLVSAQTITPAAKLRQDIEFPLQRRQSIASEESASSSSLSSRRYCLLDDPGCKESSSINDVCSAQYGTDFVSRQWCGCTTNIIKPARECQSCQNATMEGTQSWYFDEVSSLNSVCASLSYKFGNATSRPSDYFDPADFIETSPISFSGTAARTSSVSIPTDNFLSGLILDGATATPIPRPAAATPTNGASRRIGVGTMVFWSFGLVLLSSKAVIGY